MHTCGRITSRNNRYLRAQQRPNARVHLKTFYRLTRTPPACSRLSCGPNREHGIRRASCRHVARSRSGPESSAHAYLPFGIGMVERHISTSRGRERNVTTTDRCTPTIGSRPGAPTSSYFRRDVDENGKRTVCTFTHGRRTHRPSRMTSTARHVRRSSPSRGRKRKSTRRTICMEMRTRSRESKNSTFETCLLSSSPQPPNRVVQSRCSNKQPGKHVVRFESVLVSFFATSNSAYGFVEGNIIFKLYTPLCWRIETSSQTL